jgi:hypothetical protein
MYTLAIKRFPYSFVLGGTDDKFFFTLEPGMPMEFNASFGLANDMRGDHGTFALLGHRYLMDVQPGEKVEWWKRGRKEDVLDIEGAPSRNASVPYGKPIPLKLDAPVEFSVLPLE